MATDMTKEPLRGAMVGEGDAAIGTFGNETAFRALQRRRPTPPIEKEDDLFLAFESLEDGLLQAAGKNGNALFRPRFLPHVDDAHDRQALVVDPAGHIQERIF